MNRWRIQYFLRYIRSLVAPFGNVEKFLTRETQRTGTDLGFTPCSQQLLVKEMIDDLREVELSLYENAKK